MDLYSIPGDTGKFWRLDKFVEYQHEVPSIHYRVLGEYIKRCKLSLDDAVMMCWYMSCTYNEVTCILLNEIFHYKDLSQKNIQSYCEEFWGVWKNSLDFGSSRKYAKSMDWFPVLMCEFIKATHNQPYEWLERIYDKSYDPADAYRRICEKLEEFPYVGRFARDLFMESICYIQDYLNMALEEPSLLDWKRCSNLTSGVLNIVYKDAEANEFDKFNRLPEGITEERLTRYLMKIQKRIHMTYPEQDDSINMFVGKICSFRNLFKASRYGGFHHDRELGVLIAYEKEFPKYSKLWNRVYKLRKSMFPERFLGELHDWEGIRPERKKLWLEKGMTGVEPEIFDKC